MGFSIAEIWHSMGFMARAVAISLMVMGIACVAVTIERMLFLSRSRKQSKAFAKDASPVVAEGRFEDIEKIAKKYPVSQLARLSSAGAVRFVAFTDEVSDSGLSGVEAAKREMARRAEALSAELRKGMGVLASVGSVAPFVGLFGTVVGIITAFEGIAKTGAGGLGAVSAGIAEALMVTALGLIVAIPSVLLFNFLNTKIDDLELALGNASGEFLDEMERCYGNRNTQGRVGQAAE